MFKFGFPRTRVGTKLIFSFVIMASVGAGIGFVSSFELDRILQPLTHDIPRSLSEVRRTYHLDTLAQQIRHYDQILTEAMREYAYSGDRQFKYRYEEFEPRLDLAIQEAIQKGDDEDQKIFSGLQKTKSLFTSIEAQAIRAVDAGDAAKAREIIENPGYWNLKRDYKKSLDVYVERRGRQYGESLNFTARKVDALVADTHRLVERSKKTVLKFSFIAMLVAVLLGAYVSRTLLRPIHELQKGAEIIGKGNLDHRINITSDDEIGKLARSFDEMARKLGEFYTGLESKVKDKTQELAQRVDEIQKQNRALERTKEATMNILEDLEAARLEAEEEKAKYQAILSSIGDGMIATDAKGCIMMVNAQAELMLGFESRTMIGKNIGSAFAYENERRERIPAPERPVYQAIESAKKIAAHAYYVRKDGTSFPAAVTVSPVTRNGRIIGAIEIFRDISREKEIDRMKTEFISTVSHELRTPLTVIREGVNLVLDRVLGPVTDDQNEFLGIALKDIDRLGRIIDNLLDISKIEAGKIDLKRSFFNLTDAADQVLSAFAARAKGKGLELRKQYSSADLPLYADKDRLVEVFTNLVGNAMKFTEKGFIEISLKEEPSSILCSVRDSGRGISQEDMKRVFGKFEQLGERPHGGERGTGLGLSIAKGIVELHRGRIWVESTYGEGTVFFFRLPRQTPEEVLSDHLTKSLREAMHDRKILSVLALEPAPGVKETAALLDRISGPVHSCAERCGAEVFQNELGFYILLPGVDRSESQEKISRFRAELEAAEGRAVSDFVFREVHYPEDGSTGEQLISSLRAA